MYWNKFYDMKEGTKNSNNKHKANIYKTKLSYCLKWRKNTESKNSKVVRTKNGRIILLSKCSVCNSKRMKFIKEQEDRGLLSSLGIWAALIQIPLLGPLFF